MPLVQWMQLDKRNQMGTVYMLMLMCHQNSTDMSLLYTLEVDCYLEYRSNPVDRVDKWNLRKQMPCWYMFQQGMGWG